MRKQTGILFILFIMLAAANMNAQLSSANKYYANYEYANAIPYYLKVIKKGNNIVAQQNLANCYRLTKDYTQAELYYSQAVQQAGVEPITFFYYGLVLKNNKKYDEAAKQFNRYMELAPSDKKAQLSVKTIGELKQMMEKPSRFEVLNVSTINTASAEFAPSFYKTGLVFTSNREADLVNFQSSAWNKAPYFNLFFTEHDPKGDKNTFKTAEPFSKKINTLYHDGFSSFSSDASQLIFTRIEAHPASNKIMEPHIYTAKASNGKWESASLIQLADDSVWVSHPSLSADGQQLFFASDMPGGFGGKDIYVSKKEGDKWSAAQNLGSSINTALDEVFPYIRKDNVLYFCSTGHAGLGGFDIFSSSLINSKWSKPENLGAPLNSPTDDFGIVFAEDNSSGYFSSDRPDGKGADDIYSFVQSKLISMKGKVLSAKDIKQPAKGVKLLLLSEDGKVIGVTSSDSLGFFRFENLSPDVQYLVKMDETDPHFNFNKKYYLANEQDKIVRVTVVNARGERFIFQKLQADLVTLQPDSVLDNKLKIAGTLLVGDNPSKPYASKKVSLLNEKGEVVQVVYTNDFGSFLFTELEADKTYFISADEKDVALSPNSKIILTNSSAKEIITVKANASGAFRFQLLKGENHELAKLKVEDDQLRIDMKGRLYADTLSKPLANVKVELLNQKGKVQQTITTKADGGFLFTALPFNESFLLQMDEKDQRFKNIKKIIFTNEKGVVIKVIILNKESSAFKFQLLPADYKTISTAYVDDPWLKVLKLKQTNTLVKTDSIKIVENIYYNLNDYQVLAEAKKVLDKVVNLMKNDSDLIVEIGSHTDSRASDDYNMKLSQKRAKTAAAYIVENGISEKRVRGVGYGETHLVNRCGNGSDCFEEEHAQNRRTEFIVHVR
jgi:outer membrane protein OmpA-like peptidoglycan-associated protein